MKKFTWLIGASLLAIAFSVIIYRGIEYNHFHFQEIGGLILVLFLIGLSLIAIMVAWEQENYLWLIPLGFTFMDIMSGSGAALIVGIVVPTLFVIIRFNSWKTAFRKIMA